MTVAEVLIERSPRVSASIAESVHAVLRQRSSRNLAVSSANTAKLTSNSQLPSHLAEMLSIVQDQFPALLTSERSTTVKLNATEERVAVTLISSGVCLVSDDQESLITLSPLPGSQRAYLAVPDKVLPVFRATRWTLNLSCLSNVIEFMAGRGLVRRCDSGTAGIRHRMLFRNPTRIFDPVIIADTSAVLTARPAEVPADVINDAETVALNISIDLPLSTSPTIMTLTQSLTPSMFMPTAFTVPSISFDFPTVRPFAPPRSMNIKYKSVKERASVDLTAHLPARAAERATALLARVAEAQKDTQTPLASSDASDDESSDSELPALEALEVKEKARVETRFSLTAPTPIQKTSVPMVAAPVEPSKSLLSVAVEKKMKLAMEDSGNFLAIDQAYASGNPPMEQLDVKKKMVGNQVVSRVDKNVTGAIGHGQDTVLRAKADVKGTSPATQSTSENVGVSVPRTPQKLATGKVKKPLWRKFLACFRRPQD